MKDVHWWQQQKPFISHLSLVSKEPVAIAGPEPTTSRAGGIHANQLTTSANPFFTFSTSEAIFDHQTFLASLTFLESRMMGLGKRPVRGLGKERARVRECEREREKEGGRRGRKSRSLLTDTNLRRHFNGWTAQERYIAA